MRVESVAKQEIVAAAPIEPPLESSRDLAPPPMDPGHPTPIAQAIVPRVIALPPEPTLLEVDKRIERLLGEIATLTMERKRIYENLSLAQERSSACLEYARRGKRLAKEYLVAMEKAVLHPTDERMETEDLARHALRAWADEIL